MVVLFSFSSVNLFHMMLTAKNLKDLYFLSWTTSSACLYIIQKLIWLSQVASFTISDRTMPSYVNFEAFCFVCKRVRDVVGLNVYLECFVRLFFYHGKAMGLQVDNRLVEMSYTFMYNKVTL